MQPDVGLSPSNGGVDEKSSSQPGFPEDKQTPGKTILVVEDDTETGELFLVALLEDADTHYHVYLATSGAEALNFSRQIKPNLFIVDYRLRDITGIELYDQLYTIPELAAVPFLLVSASRLPVDEIQKRSLAYMNKPFELEDFIATVEKLITDQ